MSAVPCHTAIARPTILSTLLQILRRKHPAPGLTDKELTSLPDHLLVDIGVDPRDVARPTQRELDRIELLYRGWRRSPRNYR